MDRYTSMVLGVIFGTVIVGFGLYYSYEASVVASTELDTIRLYKGDIFKTTVPSNGYLMKVYYVLTDTKPAYDVCTINMFGYETVNPATSTLQCIKGSQIMIGTKLYTISAIDLNFVDLVEVV
jgi:hypothetical protein